MKGVEINNINTNYGFTNKPVNFMGKSQVPKLLTEKPKVLAENVKDIAKALEMTVDTFVKTVKK